MEAMQAHRTTGNWQGCVPEWAIVTWIAVVNLALLFGIERRSYKVSGETNPLVLRPDSTGKWQGCVLSRPEANHCPAPTTERSVSGPSIAPAGVSLLVKALHARG